MKSTAQTRKGAVLVLLAALCWSTLGAFARLMNSIGLRSLELTQVRVTTAFAVVLLFLLIKDRSLFKIRLKDLWCFVGTGICSLLMYCVCYFKALESASISVVTVLSYMAPVYIMLMGTVLFHEKITKRKIVGLSLSVIGCVLTSGVLFGASGSKTGLLLGLAAGFFYALYSVFTKLAIVRGYQIWAVLLYTFGFATFGCSFVSDWNVIGTVLAPHIGRVVLSILFGGITCFLPYALYSKGLQMIEVSKASVINCADVVFSSLIGAFVFHEHLTFLSICGIVLVLTSIAVMTLSKTKPCAAVQNEPGSTVSGD